VLVRLCGFYSGIVKLRKPSGALAATPSSALAAILSLSAAFRAGSRHALIQSGIGVAQSAL
ncbi:MAG: hypothetical protein ACRD3O_12285, partial [Terriglobia bacterium]